MPAGSQSVGERLRVFTRNAGLKVTTGCVIEAHGEQLFMGNTMRRNFQVPVNTTIVFYTPHGAPQKYRNGTVTFKSDPALDYRYTNALDHIANGEAVAVDTYTAGMTCPNYNLTKIQHTDGWWNNFWGERNDMTYTDVTKFLNYKADAMDIVTIRNRRLRSDITLLEAITELRANDYRYAVHHCSFCRSAAYYQCGAPAAVSP